MATMKSHIPSIWEKSDRWRQKTAAFFDCQYDLSSDRCNNHRAYTKNSIFITISKRDILISFPNDTNISVMVTPMRSLQCYVFSSRPITSISLSNTPIWEGPLTEWKRLFIKGSTWILYNTMNALQHYFILDCVHNELIIKCYPRVNSKVSVK